MQIRTHKDVLNLGNPQIVVVATSISDTIIGPHISFYLEPLLLRITLLGDDGGGGNGPQGDVERKQEA